MSDYRLIDYDHSQDDRTCNAVLMAERGGAQAMWAVDDGGELVHVERAIAMEAFVRLWDGITASLDAGGAFWSGLVTDPSRLVDAATHHVVTTVQVAGGQVRHRTFMVPLCEVDAAFVAWLSLLGSTRQTLPELPTLAGQAGVLVAA